MLVRKVLFVLVFIGSACTRTSLDEQLHGQETLAKLLFAFNMPGKSPVSCSLGTTVKFCARRLQRALISCSPERSNLQYLPEILNHAPSLQVKYHLLEDDDRSELALLKNTTVTQNLSKDDEDTVLRALEVAFVAHHGQKRRSGEPFVYHPHAVAGDLMSRGMDVPSVVAGLLHDTVEDTELSLDEIEKLFGTTVKSIVLGETKVSKLPKLVRSTYAPSFSEESHGTMDEQAENLRSMFMAMAEDYRIVAVKLADRLHNMKTLMHMPQQKQQIISRETLQVFVPLAHRLGMWYYKEELEDLSFKYLYPSEYSTTSEYIKKCAKESEDAVRQTTQELKNLLEKDHPGVEIFPRQKSVYRTWRKMQKLNCRIEQIKDILALRVVLNVKAEQFKDSGAEASVCYEVLRKVHFNWHLCPECFKDYIARAKPNGYQSLHTTILVNETQPLEIQIRTSSMHEVAEKGAAADQKQYDVPWLKVQAENKHLSAPEFVQYVREELHISHIFVCTRDGKILQLKSGSTVSDAAEKLDLAVDKHEFCVNDESATRWQQLKNGDVISFSRADPRHKAEEREKPEFCQHCLPVPGDKLIACRSSSPRKPLTVHRADCDCHWKKKQLAVQGYELLNEDFVPEKEDLSENGYPAQLIVFVRDRTGVLMEITRIIMEHASLLGVSTEVRAPDQEAALQFTVRVDNATHLATVKQAVDNSPDTVRVLRDNMNGLLQDPLVNFWGFGAKPNEND